MKNKSIFDNKIVQILFPVIVALCMWMYVITVVSPGSETTISDVPVVLSPSEKVLWDRGLMIVSDHNMTVDLSLAGNRSDLNKLSKSNVYVSVDLTKIYDAGTHNMSYSVVTPGDIPNNAITTQSKIPDSVKLVVVERAEKEVPVVVKFEGTTPESYVKEEDKVELEFETVKVFGPKDVVDTIAQAEIVVNLNDHSASFTHTDAFVLYDKDHVEVSNEFVTTENDISQVSVTVPIAMIKEIPLKVSVIPGGGATEENTKISLSDISISVTGPETILKDLDELQIATIDLGEITKSGSFEYEIKLPEGVENETGITKVTVTVTLPELMTYTFQVTQIEYTNLPNGMKAALTAKAVEVVVRGSSAQVSQMDADDLTVLVDLSQAQVGTEKYTATIVISDEFPGVGAMGSYSVAATVSEK